MSQDEFTKLFKYMTQRFDAVEKRFDETASAADMQRVFTSLDALLRQQEISDDERLVMGHQLDRLNKVGAGTR